MDVEAYDLAGDNCRASHQNHATWTEDAGQRFCMPDTDNAEVRIRPK
jgi:hypothetical protein